MGDDPEKGDLVVDLQVACLAKQPIKVDGHLLDEQPGDSPALGQ